MGFDVGSRWANVVTTSSGYGTGLPSEQSRPQTELDSTSSTAGSGQHPYAATAYIPHVVGAASSKPGAVSAEPGAASSDLNESGSTDDNAYDRQALPRTNLPGSVTTTPSPHSGPHVGPPREDTSGIARPRAAASDTAEQATSWKKRVRSTPSIVLTTVAAGRSAMDVPSSSTA